MPDGKDNSAIIGAAGSVLGAGINAYAQQQANQANLDYARVAYNLSHKDALEFWNMQNAYNDPAAQMARFRGAGLNPNLIYGQGNSGNAAAPDVPQFRPPDIKSTRPGDAIQAGALSYMNAVYDLKIKAAQANNLEAQNSVIKQDAILKGVQAALGSVNTQRSAFDLDFLQDMRSTNADIRREELRQIGTNIQVAQDSNARAAVSQAMSLNEAAERIKTMQLGRQYTIEDMHRIRATVSNLQKDGTLKQLDINLRELGIQPGSPLWTTVAGQVMQRIMDDPMGGAIQAVKSASEAIKSTISIRSGNVVPTPGMFPGFLFNFSH